MNIFQDKTAVISGGAEGIGLAVAQALGARGMNIVIADINVEQLQQAEESLSAAGIPVLAAELDVANASQWQNVAEQALARFGKLHMVVNNAGVGGSGGTIEETDSLTWQWVLDVNLMGVVHGTRAIVPHIKAHGEGGWVVNVASMAGFTSLPLATPYSATKAAVVAMTENWAFELEPEGIHACVLCPGFAQTRIHKSERNRPQRYSGEATGGNRSEEELGGMLAKVVEEGMPVAAVAERLVEALQAKELYVFTHPTYGVLITSRFRNVEEAFERTKSSEALADYQDFAMPSF